MLMRGILLAAMVSIGVVPAAAEAKTVLKMGMTVTPDSYLGRAATTFAEEVDRLSDGQVEIELFPNAALGGEREQIESLTLGSLDLFTGSTGALGNFAPATLILDIPLLFKDYRHAHAVLDSPIGDELLAELPARGLVPLGWGDIGFRHLTNSRHPAETLEDIKGLKIRTMENDAHIAAWKAVGAQPTPMSWTETIQALQSRTVDGQENPIAWIWFSKLYQFQEHMTLTGLNFSPAILLMSKNTWEGLSDQEKEILQKAGKTFTKASRDNVAHDEAASLKKLEEAGVKIVREIDLKPIEAALQPAYAEFKKQFGEAKIDQIRNFEY